MFANIRTDIRRARRANVGPDWWSQRVKVLFQLSTLAVLSYRFCHWTLTRRFPVRLLLMLPAVICRSISQLLTGVHISPEAEIGPGLLIHTVYGIFVGRRKIGANCHLQTGVVIQYGRRPIGDNVYLGAGSKVIGSAAIGNNVRVGPNSLVMTDVPNDSAVFGVPARIRLPIGRKQWFERTSADGAEAQACPDTRPKPFHENEPPTLRGLMKRLLLDARSLILLRKS